MSGPLKFVAILGASLLGLLVLAIVVALIALPPLMRGLMSNARSPAEIARVEREIGSFQVPPGYVASVAFDAPFTSSVVIRSNEVRRRGRGFEITLMKLSLPVADPELSQRKARFGSWPLGTCTEDPNGDRVVLARTVVVLEARVCSGMLGRSRVEMGRIPTQRGVVMLTATATPPETFDRSAVHLLLNSFR